MSQQAEFPDEGERQAFLEKLGQFRRTLSQSEQRFLDAMATVAFTPYQPHSDVQGYGWQTTPTGVSWAGPRFYHTGWAYQWEYTPWGAAYMPVATGVWTPRETEDEETP